jgi:hypothetical protein
MENIGRPEDEWDFLWGKDNNHPSLKMYRKPKDRPYNPSEDDLKVLEEAKEAVGKLARKARTDMLQKNIIIKQLLRNQRKILKGEIICKSQKTSENSPKRYQNFKGQ